MAQRIAVILTRSNVHVSLQILAIPISIITSSFHGQYNILMRANQIQEEQAHRLRQAERELIRRSVSHEGDDTIAAVQSALTSIAISKSGRASRKSSIQMSTEDGASAKINLSSINDTYNDVYLHMAASLAMSNGTALRRRWQRAAKKNLEVFDNDVRFFESLLTASHALQSHDIDVSDAAELSNLRARRGSQWLSASEKSTATLRGSRHW